VKDYCSAHLLVSEPSEVSKPNLGLAADYRAVSSLRLPAIHPVFTALSPKRAALSQPPALPLSYPGLLIMRNSHRGLLIALGQRSSLCPTALPRLWYVLPGMTPIQNLNTDVILPFRYLSVNSLRGELRQILSLGDSWRRPGRTLQALLRWSPTRGINHRC